MAWQVISSVPSGSHWNRNAPVPTRPDPNPKDVPLTTFAGGGAALKANEVIAAYVDARSRRGLSTDRDTRGTLGKYARQVLASGRWSPELVLEATESFAVSRRHVRFFAEWCATIFNQRTEAEHIAHKAEEKQEAPKTRGKMRSLAEILVTPGSRPPESRE